MIVQVQLDTLREAAHEYLNAYGHDETAAYAAAGFTLAYAAITLIDEVANSRDEVAALQVQVQQANERIWEEVGVAIGYRDMHDNVAGQVGKLAGERDELRARVNAMLAEIDRARNAWDDNWGESDYDDWLIAIRDAGAPKPAKEGKK